MSRLSDLLSKIKQSDLKKEIPLLFFIILTVASLSLGLATAPAAFPSSEESPSGIESNSESLHNEQVSNLFYLARTYEMSGELLKAVETYSKALQIDPGNYKTMNNISALMIRLDMWDESLGYLLESIKLNNQYVPALINLGIVYAKTGKFSESEEMLLHAVSLEENNRLALLNIAILYEKEGLYERAREYYQRLRILGDIEGGKGLKRIDNRQLKPSGIP